ncbi:phosphatase PAP2 family protein [Roseicella sp. DB1501]|uniref:phosphatase PAP2 family protein n=1 Tax=Roseicella sp. DB1501 TaxID=2730925 RepID=UPI00349FD671
MLPFAMLAGTLWGFVWLAGEVVEGDTRAFDTRLLLLLRNSSDPSDPIGPLWFEEMARDFTALGSVGVLSLVTVAVAGFLLFARRRGAALLVAMSIGGGWLLTEALKHGFERPRPDLVPHGTVVFTSSFPSSHAAMSAVVYLTLGTLLARLQTCRSLKIYVMTSATFLALLVGATRVYLAVHWPSDVLAGWAVGAAWALACWLAMRWLQRCGRVERNLPERTEA